MANAVCQVTNPVTDSLGQRKVANAVCQVTNPVTDSLGQRLVANAVCQVTNPVTDSRFTQSLPLLNASRLPLRNISDFIIVLIVIRVS